MEKKYEKLVEDCKKKFTDIMMATKLNSVILPFTFDQTKKDVVVVANAFRKQGYLVMTNFAEVNTIEIFINKTK